jgi:hypothetical protein
MKVPEITAVTDPDSIRQHRLLLWEGSMLMTALLDRLLYGEAVTSDVVAAVGRYKEFADTALLADRGFDGSDEQPRTSA